MMRMSAAAVALVLVGCGMLAAEPLDETLLGADAKWIAHVDFDALRASATVQTLAKPWLESKGVRRALAKIRDGIGLDLVEDLHGITSCGPRPKEGRGAALIAADIDRKRLEAFLAMQPDYATTRYEDYKVHSWTHHDQRGDATMHGCFPKTGLLVCGPNLGDLKAALDVLGGRRPNLAAGDSSLRGSAPAGTVLDLRAAGLAKAELPLKSPIIRLSELLRIALGEHNGTAFVEAKLVACSEENVRNIRDVVVGAVAFARLYYNDNEDALKILDAIHVTVEGPVVMLSWRGQAADVALGIGRQIIKHRAGDR